MKRVVITMCLILIAFISFGCIGDIDISDYKIKYHDCYVYDSPYYTNTDKGVIRLVKFDEKSGRNKYNYMRTGRFCDGELISPIWVDFGVVFGAYDNCGLVVVGDSCNVLKVNGTFVYDKWFGFVELKEDYGSITPFNTNGIYGEEYGNLENGVAIVESGGLFNLLLKDGTLARNEWFSSIVYDDSLYCFRATLPNGTIQYIEEDGKPFPFYTDKDDEVIKDGVWQNLAKVIVIVFLIALSIIILVKNKKPNIKTNLPKTNNISTQYSYGNNCHATNNQTQVKESTPYQYQQQTIEEVKPQPQQEDSKPKPKPCYVYLMGDGRSYKIGISNNVQRRLKDFQTGNPYIKIITYKKFINQKEAQKIEKMLHQQYAHCNVGLEWFNPTDDELTTIKTLLS